MKRKRSHSQPPRSETLVGVISDTHGLLRPEALSALQASDLILHAGDIGNPDILEQLRTIAPVVAVRGNNDCGAWAEAIPAQETVTIAGVSIHMLHIVKQLNFDPQAAAVQIVISGHSHKPALEQRQGALFLNPGSAGPRRFKLPVSIAQITLNQTLGQIEILELLPTTTVLTCRSFAIASGL